MNIKKLLCIVLFFVTTCANAQKMTKDEVLQKLATAASPIHSRSDCQICEISFYEQPRGGYGLGKTKENQSFRGVSLTAFFHNRIFSFMIKFCRG